MNKLIYLLMLLLFIGERAAQAESGIPLPSAAPPAVSADVEGDLQDQRIRKVLPEYQPTFTATSVADVTALNPIKLQISVVDKTPVITQEISLEDAVGLSLRYSPALLGAVEAVEATRWLTRAAWSKLGPSASVNTFFSQSSIDQMLFFVREQVDPPPMQPVTKGTAFHLIFAGYQPLFTGGRLIYTARAAAAREAQSVAASNAQRITNATDAKTAYWDAVLAEENLRISHDYAKFRQWSTKNMRERVAVGKAPRADLLREEGELSKAEIEVNDRYGDYNKALVRLKTVMGVSITSLISLRDRLDKNLTIKTLDEYLVTARQTNPAVQQAEARLSEARANRRVVAAKFSPQAGLYGLASNSSGQTPGRMDTVSGKWGGTLGIMAGMTLFNSGERLFELRNASGALRQAEAERLQAVLQAVQDATQAWIDYQTATSNLALTRAELASAAEDQRLMHARYLVGKAIALEDFDASVRLFRARLALLQRMYAQNIAVARLQSASGLI